MTAPQTPPTAMIRILRNLLNEALTAIDEDETNHAKHGTYEVNEGVLILNLGYRARQAISLADRFLKR